jgi:hypothetical protein
MRHALTDSAFVDVDTRHALTDETFADVSDGIVASRIRVST